jgi:four helix bundle protein
MDSLKPEDLEVYQLAPEVGQEVWRIVDKRESFSKNTVGKQFVNAADPVSANIAEGYGRYFYRDSKNLCYYSHDSLMETKN